jgi:hypothetical protein
VTLESKSKQHTLMEEDTISRGRSHGLGSP